MCTKGKASKLISVLLVAVMVVTLASVSFAETGQSSDVTTPVAQYVDNTSGAADSSADGNDVDSQASDTDTGDGDITSTEGVTNEEGSTGDEDAVEETAEDGFTLFASKKSYTITFDSNGGSGYVNSITTADGKFTFPSGDSLKRTGWTFMGWGQSQDTGHCDTSNGSIPKDAAHYSIYEPGDNAQVSRDTTYYAVWAQEESAQYFIRLDGTVPREPGDYSVSLYTNQVGKGKTVKYNTFYANSNVADEGVKSHLGTTPTTAEIMNACNVKANSIRFSDGSSYEGCSTTTEFEQKYYVIWYVIKNADGTIHVDGSLLKRSLYNVTYEPNAKAGEYTGTVPATKQYAVDVKVTVESSNLEREGYVFMGWELSIDGKTYNVGDTFTMPEGNVVLKAIWQKQEVPEYTVKCIDKDTETVLYSETLTSDDVEGGLSVGQEVEVEAPDIEGYVVTGDATKNITISGDNSENVIVFYYEKKPEMTISATGYEGLYDGAAHSGTVTSSLEDDSNTVYTYYQNVGTEESPAWEELDEAPSITDVQRDSENNVVALHYKVEASNDEYSTPEPAYFDIKIKPLLIEVNKSFSEQYTGNPVECKIEPEVDQTENGVLKDETLNLDATISGTESGTYDEPTVKSWSVLKADGKTDSTVNYDIEVTAVLVIEKTAPDAGVLSIEIENYEGVYDGKSHRSEATLSGDEAMIDNTEIQYSSDGGESWTTDEPSIKTVGKKECLVRAYNENFEEDQIPMKEFTLEVTPRKLVVYAEAEYMYDGKEKVLNITADDIINRGYENEGLADGEQLILNDAMITGTSSGVYTDVSEYEAKVVKPFGQTEEGGMVEMVDGGDALEFEETTENYDIQVGGTLTIGDSEANNPLINGGNGTKLDNGTNGTDGTDGAKTGDTAPVGILFGLLALAACGGGFAAFGRRKREE